MWEATIRWLMRSKSPSTQEDPINIQYVNQHLCLAMARKPQASRIYARNLKARHASVTTRLTCRQAARKSTAWPSAQTRHATAEYELTRRLSMLMRAVTIARRTACLQVAHELIRSIVTRRSPRLPCCGNTLQQLHHVPSAIAVPLRTLGRKPWA